MTRTVPAVALLIACLGSSAARADYTAGQALTSPPLTGARQYDGSL
ncbi:MAG: hypothetical protein WD749_15505 [Phycisphaerales bacterium]